jgi:uncharacterized protein
MQRFLPLLLVTSSLLFISSSAARAADAPAKIKTLIITGDDVAVHNWKETTAAIRKILLDSGRFEVVVSEDLKPLESADGLKSYDVIVLNRYNRTAPLRDAAKQNLLDFIRGGKGFFIQHLASASFPNWSEFDKLCGRYWVMGNGKSGHGPRSPFDTKVVDNTHPISAGMKDFRADDELYSRLQGDEPIHVLVEAHSDFSKKTEPIYFWLPYGQGRVVHCTFGHDGKAIAVPEVTTLIVRGVEWAATGKVK